MSGLVHEYGRLEPHSLSPEPGANAGRAMRHNKPGDTTNCRFPKGLNGEMVNANNRYRMTQQTDVITRMRGSTLGGYVR